MNPRYPSLVFLVLLLAACAQQPVKTETPAPEKAVEAPAKKAVPKSPDLPNLELSENILYEFMLAEMAWQRGNLDIATGAYLDLAKKTRDPRIAQRATEVALHARMPTVALEAAALWLEFDPESTQARQTIAALLVTSGKLDEARSHLEALIAGEDENTGQAFLQLNGLLARHPDKAAVLALVQQLAKPYPKLAEAHFAVAQAAWNAGQQDAALAEIKQARAIRPDWELAVLFQGQILQRTSNSLALAHFRDFLKKYPKARDVRLNYARLLVTDKQYSQARSQFQQLIADFPGNGDVVLAVGLLSIQLKDLDAAEANFKAVLDMEYRDYDTVRFYLAQVYEEMKRLDDAMTWYRMVGRGEQYLPAQVRYVGLLAKQGKLDEARKHLQQVPVQNNQQRAQLTMAEAQLLRETGAYQEAFELLGSALEKLPNYPDLLYDYAMAAEKVNRFDLLEANLRKLIQLKPDHAHAYNALGYSLAERNDRLPEARELIEKALTLAPDDPFITDSMGWVLYRLGNLGEALTYLRRAYADRPDPEIAAHLGEVLWVQGEREEARKIWHSALKENPGNDLLLNTIKRFAP